MSEPVEFKNRTQNNLIPRAIVHKKILDAAKEHPEYPIEELAEEIDGATIQLVERVLDKYGDPANDDMGSELADSSNDINEQTMSTDGSDDTGLNSSPTTSNKDRTSEEGSEDSPESSSQIIGADQGDSAPDKDSDSKNSEQSEGEQASKDQRKETQSKPEKESQSFSSDTPSKKTEPSDGQRVPDADTLSQKRLEVLRAIRDRPHATQAEIADELNVSRATISRRVNAIDGFEWGNRLEFIDMMFDESEQRSSTSEKDTHNQDLRRRLANIEDRIETIEGAVGSDTEPQGSTFDDPELTTTVIRACIDSEMVTEEEEEEIIRNLIQNE